MQQGECGHSGSSTLAKLQGVILFQAFPFSAFQYTLSLALLSMQFLHISSFNAFYCYKRTKRVIIHCVSDYVFFYNVVIHDHNLCHNADI